MYEQYLQTSSACSLAEFKKKEFYCRGNGKSITIKLLDRALAAVSGLADVIRDRIIPIALHH